MIRDKIFCRDGQWYRVQPVRDGTVRILKITKPEAYEALLQRGVKFKPVFEWINVAE